MPGLSAIIAFSLTLGLVLFRPKIGRLPSPGLAIPVAIGIVIMLAGGAISTTDVAAAFQDLAKPLVGLTCMCVSAALARSLGGSSIGSRVWWSRRSGSLIMTIPSLFVGLAVLVLVS